MPFLIALAGVGHLRLLFALSPAYTCLVSLKATGPAWKPDETLAHPRPLCDLGAFFASAISLWRVGWGSFTADRFRFQCPVFPPPSDPPPFAWNEWRRFQNSTLETVMTASVERQSALTKALLPAYLSYHDSTFTEEITDRLNSITAALDYVENATDYAAIHDFILSPRSLSGVIRLIRREAKAASALFDAMDRLEDQL